MRDVADAAASALHATSPPGSSWSSINLAEAVPGVMTPLCASVWVPASELGLRAPFAAMGVLPAHEVAIPENPAERITGAFYGRMAVRVDFLCEMGDLIPGQTGVAWREDPATLRTGDVIRIDGAAGTVEILQRIGASSR